MFGTEIKNKCVADEGVEVRSTCMSGAQLVFL